MPGEPTFDLQSHSTYSDGALAPAEVVERAADAGVKLLALTDHDTVAGVPEALAAARVKNIDLMPAVELSSVHADAEDLHILGYDARPHRQHAAGRARGLPRRPRPPHPRRWPSCLDDRRLPGPPVAGPPAPRRRSSNARHPEHDARRALRRLPRPRRADLRAPHPARPSRRRSTSSTPPAGSRSGRTRTGTSTDAASSTTSPASTASRSSTHSHTRGADPRAARRRPRAGPTDDRLARTSTGRRTSTSIAFSPSTCTAWNPTSAASSSSALHRARAGAAAGRGARHAGATPSRSVAPQSRIARRVTPLQAQTSGSASLRGRGRRVAEHDRADQLAAAVDLAPVVAGARVERDDLVVAVELAHAEEVDARDLQPCRHRAGQVGGGRAGDVGGGRARHRQRGRDEARPAARGARRTRRPPTRPGCSCAASRRRGRRGRPAAPMRRASSISGTTPAATTTRSASIRSPSCSSTRSSAIARRHALAAARRCPARAARARASGPRWRRAGAPSAAAPRWTTVTAMPRLATARAASSPSSPPPITTARRAPWVRPRIVRTSCAGAERDRVLDALDRRHERARAGGQDERVVGDGRPSASCATPSRASTIRAAALDPALAVPALVVQRKVGRLAVAGEVVGEPDAVVREPGLARSRA